MSGSTCFYVFDRIWYAAESWSHQVHNNFSGGSLFFISWLWIVVVPLFIPLSWHYLGWLPTVTALPFLCFIPALFCKLRYSPDRCKAIVRHYGTLKHPGGELALIILISILLTIANFALMFHLGFMYWAA